jgi:hypothetical protein
VRPHDDRPPRERPEVDSNDVIGHIGEPD